MHVFHRGHQKGTSDTRSTQAGIAKPARAAGQPFLDGSRGLRSQHPASPNGPGRCAAVAFAYCFSHPTLVASTRGGSLSTNSCQADRMNFTLLRSRTGLRSEFGVSGGRGRRSLGAQVLGRRAKSEERKRRRFPRRTSYSSFFLIAFRSRPSGDSHREPNHNSREPPFKKICQRHYSPRCS
jgi:hypothetical protein